MGSIGEGFVPEGQLLQCLPGFGGKGQSPARQHEHPATGGGQEEPYELKIIQQTSLGCVRREIQGVMEYLRLGLRALLALIACHLWDKSF